MHPSLAEQDHRPWPIPVQPWTWRQSWRDLLFIHWPVDAALLRPLVPPQLSIQEFGGTSWIGMVPFRMAGVMRRPWPDLPWISAFPQLNLRVYVEAQDRPGVWFLSINAPSLLAVWAAEQFFHLPYQRADIALRREGEQVAYTLRREDAAFAAHYAPTSDVFRAAPGSLEHWLTERYCLYALDAAGILWRNQVHHAPWPLQLAQATLHENSLPACHGVPVSAQPALLHFSRRIDVVLWDAERVAA